MNADELLEALQRIRRRHADTADTINLVIDLMAHLDVALPLETALKAKGEPK